MSDSQFPGAGPDAFPGSAGGGAGGDGGDTVPTTTGGAYPVYIVIPMSIDSPLSLKQGDFGPKIYIQMKWLGGTPMDLTGKDVALHMQSIGGGSLTIDAAAVVEFAPLGIVSYTIAEGDTDTPGSYNVELHATNSDESVGLLTYPSDSYLRLKVIADI